MSRFANFIKGVTSPFVSDTTRTESEKRARVRRRRRERYNSPDKTNTAERGKTRKDEDDGPINRLVTVNEDVRDNIRGNARSKPYDPVFLRDISANAVVQAYIDTLSQDVSSTEWAIKPRDEDADISADALAKVERHIKQLPPGNQTFADLLESTTRVLLELGDAAIVKHHYENNPNRVAELVSVDSASLFKLVDKHGIPEGYVQISKRGGKKVDEFDVEDVVWAEWSNRPDRFYGQGPLEKAQNEVELIEELAEKERLDLIQGGPPGVVSPEALDEYGGLPNDEDWDTFVEGMRLDQGERHRVGYSKTPVNFEPINHNYQELQILDRSKYWVTVIGSVFKVNPSYAGFDFENVNRATDESQRESFKQRGFRVTLRQLEEALNRGFIWSDISEDVKFEFTKEQTIDERRDRASLIEDQASAGKEMANAGRDVSLRDGRLVVEDGEIEEGDAGGGGGGGGLFGSVDDPDDADLAVDARKDDGGVRLHYPMGGVAHSSQDQYASFLNDVASNGGRIIDTKGFDNGDERVWPPDEPDAHDPRMVVYGLDETDVLALLDRYPDVHLQINTDADTNAKAEPGGGDGDAGLSKDQVAKLDGVLLRAYTRQIAPQSLEAIEKDAWTSDEDVPEYVIEQIESVFDAGAIFEDFKSLPGRVRDVISGTLEDALTQSQGWSLDSMVDRMSDELPRADPDDLETIARTESSKVLNEAREEGYRDRGLDDARFYWQGPGDSRTTPACEDLKIATGQASGDAEAFTNPPGEPVSLSKLVDLERQAHDYHFPNLSFRKHTLHPNERHTFVRAAGTGGDEPDVDLSGVEVPNADAFTAEGGPVEPAELSAKSHDDHYDDVVERVAKATTVTRRVGEIEDALGASLPVVLRECLESAGSTRGAHKELNRRLADADDWDIDEDGKVSTATIYEWADRYAGHVDHLR